MSQTRLTDLGLGDLLTRLASRDPVPGGGSASALAGALGAALVEMVVALTAGRTGAEPHEAALRDIAATAERRRRELLALAERDADAYAAVVAARRLPTTSEAERAERASRVADAVREATIAPLRSAEAAAAVLGLAEQLAPIGNRNALSDVGVAGLLAAAAIRGAVMNVEINLPSLPAEDRLRDEAGRRIASFIVGLDARELALRTAVAEALP